MRFVTLEELATLDPKQEEREWLVPRLIPRRGTVLLMGPPKEGKSLLAAQLARNVAQGRDVLGQPCQPARVLFLQLDTPPVVWSIMIRNLRDAGEDLSGNIFFVHPEELQPVNILTDKGKTFCREALEGTKPDFVILDVLRKVHLSDENDSTAMVAVGQALNEVFHAYALLLLHHSRKIPPEMENPDPRSFARGSSHIISDADSLWFLYGGKLRTIPRFDEPVAFKAERQDGGTWRFPETVDSDERAKQFLDLCADHPTMTHAQLAKVAHERFGVSRATYYRVMAGRTCVHSGVSPSRPLEKRDGETVPQAVP